MGFIIGEIEAECRFSQELTLEAIERAVPLAEVEAAIQSEDAAETRQRKLRMVVVAFW